MNAVERALRLLGEDVLRITKQVFQEIPGDIAVYYNAYFGEDTIGVKPREPNTGKRLRVVTAKLARATLTLEEGNITKISADKDGVTLESGIDLSVVPYARIHELGGTAGRGAKIPKRPYLRPGMDDFLDKGFPRYIKRIQDRLVKEFN